MAKSQAKNKTEEVSFSESGSDPIQNSESLYVGDDVGGETERVKVGLYF